MKLPDHLSFSSLKLYQECPFKWYLKYVENVDLYGDSYSLSNGTNLHLWLEHFYQNKVVEEKELDGWTFANYEGYTQSIGRKYLPKVVGVEQEIQVNFRGLPPITGKIDLVLTDGIVDHKSTSRNDREKIYDRQQLVLYSLWFYLKYKRLPTCSEVHYFNTTSEGYGVFEEKIIYEDFEVLEAQFRQFAKDIENDRFTPNMRAWKRTDKYYDRVLKFIRSNKA